MRHPPPAPCPVSRPTCLGHAEHRTCPSCSSMSRPRGESWTMSKAKLTTGDEIMKQSNLLCAAGPQHRAHWCLSIPKFPSGSSCSQPLPRFAHPDPPLQHGSKLSPRDTHTPTCKSTEFCKPIYLCPTLLYLFISHMYSGFHSSSLKRFPPQKALTPVWACSKPMWDVWKSLKVQPHGEVPPENSYC